MRVLVRTKRLQLKLDRSLDCLDDEIDVNIIPTVKAAEPTVTQLKSSYFNNANQFYLQSNVTIPNEGSLVTPIGDRKGNSTGRTSPQLCLTLLLLLLILFVCLLEL